VVLERFELNITTNNLSLVHEWISRTLRTITSPVFNEFVIRLLTTGYPWVPLRGDDWGAIDASLDVLAKRHPDFRVVFTGCGNSSFIASYLPLAKSNGLIRLDSPPLESRFAKLGFP